MSIKESALAAITSIAQGDFVRAVTSAGASRRITVANLAKAIIESYTGSSLAGSAQSVKSAIDSTSMTFKKSLASTDDLDDLTNGVYIWTTSRPANIPVDANYGLLIVFEGTSGGTYYNFQIASLTSRRLYYRRKQGTSTDAFSAWSLITATQV